MSRIVCSLVVLCSPLAAAQERAMQILPAPWRSVDVPAGARPVGPAVRADATGALVTWLERSVEASADTELRLARYADGKFEAPQRVRVGRDFFANWADFAAACVSRDGELLIGCLVRARGGYDLRLLQRGAAETFTELGTPYGEAGTGGEHGFVSMLPEGEDGVRLFWLDGRHYEADQRMELRSALVRGGVAQAEEVLDPDVCTCCQTGATLVDGEPMVVYRGRDVGEIRDIKWVRRTAKGWTAPRTVAIDGWVMPGCPVNGPAVATDGSHAAVAWFTGAEGKARVLLAFAAVVEGDFGAPLEVDAGAPIGRVDVVATSQGALVCWFGTAGDDATLCVQAWTAAGVAGPRAQLARLPMGRSSGFPRMAVMGGMVLLVWVDADAGRLRAASADLAALFGTK